MDQPLLGGPRQRIAVRAVRSYVADELSGDGDGPRPGFKGQYVRAFAWSCLLMSGWALTHGVCYLGVPNDCSVPTEPLLYMKDISLMLIYGLMQAWFCEIFIARRFWHLISWRRWYFYACFWGSGIVFSLISDIPALACSLSSGNSLTPLQITVYLLLLLLAGAAVLWHVIYAYRCLHTARCCGGFSSFHVYLLSRGAMFAFYGCYSWLVIQSGSKYEFHHYWIAWCVSTIAMFNHGVSLIWLACAAGIFVQGIGAYGASFLFYQD